jgi:BirA family biotin operon repressor/biotin-[acetyl-CoA-carboxylase] ligase
MDIELLKSELVREGYLREIVYFDELDSTNNFAKNNTDLQSDTLVLTSSQSKGAGRFSRQWITTSSMDLTFSLVKKFKLSIDSVHLVNFYSSYILCASLKEYLRQYELNEVILKWPNDILLNRKKVAGLLLDIKDVREVSKKIIIGIGLNVNSTEFPEELMSKATSIKNEIKETTEREKLLILIIRKFYENLNLMSDQFEIMKLWKLNSNITGKEIMLKVLDDDKELKATVLDIDNDGGLKVRLADNKVKKFYSGEIKVL